MGKAAGNTVIAIILIGVGYVINLVIPSGEQARA